MKDSATELRVSAESMRALSTHLSDAGNKLSSAIKDAVDSTRELSQQNQLSSENMEKLRDQLITDVGRFDQLTVQLTSMLSSAENTFGELKVSHTDFINQFRTEVGRLSSQMTTLLEDYGSQANATTAEHLKVWSDSVTQYSTQMTSAVKALSNVVDSIEEKLE
jgi:septal ring factor EnvC (AmiA/AmiB activator)